MASGRRGVAQQQQEQILADNPELQSFSTSLTVKENKKSKFKVDARDEDGDKVYVDLEGKEAIKGVATFVDEIDLGFVEIFALPFAPWDGPGEGPGPKPIPNDGPEGVFFFPYSQIILTEDGFGVSTDDFIPIGDVEDGPQAFDEPMLDSTISDGESLVLNVYGPYDGAPGEMEILPLKEGDEGGEGPEEPMPDFGGRSFTVEYEVISGSGTVIIGAADFDAEGPDDAGLLFEESALLGGRRSADEGSLMFEMPDGTAFESTAVSTTGSLEIVVTGIHYTTNIDSMDFLT